MRLAIYVPVYGHNYSFDENIFSTERITVSIPPTTASTARFPSHRTDQGYDRKDNLGLEFHIHGGSIELFEGTRAAAEAEAEATIFIVVDSVTSGNKDCS